MLDDLLSHIKSTVNQSLIGRIYGAFTIKTNIFAPIDIIIMQNTILRKDTNNNKLVFDLKGNTRNRKISPREFGFKRFWLKGLDHKAVFRDLNFNEINNDLHGSLVTLT